MDRSLRKVKVLHLLPFPECSLADELIPIQENKFVHLLLQHKQSTITELSYFQCKVRRIKWEEKNVDMKIFLP